MNRLVKSIRESILDGSFDKLKNDFLSVYQPTDEETRISQKKKWLDAREKKTLGE
jgi:hypothetical protein